MLGHQSLLQAKIISQAADTLILLNEPTDNHETMWVRQRPQKVARVSCVLSHIRNL